MVKDYTIIPVEKNRSIDQLPDANGWRHILDVGVMVVYNQWCFSSHST